MLTTYVPKIHINTLWTGDADLRLYITTVQDEWHKSAFLTHALFPRTIHLIMQLSCWRMFILIETWPHELMVCYKYREQTALYLPLLLCSAFNQLSDFNHFTPVTERVVLTRKNILQKMKFQRNCWRTHYLMFLTTLIVTVKMTVTLLYYWK